MFPAGYFAKSYFAGTYFPPVESVTPPAVSHGGGRYRNDPVPAGWPVDLDDEELMFWIL